MQTAIAYSRILRQMADRQRDQDKAHTEQRLIGVNARSTQTSVQPARHEQVGPRR